MVSSITLVNTVNGVDLVQCSMSARGSHTLSITLNTANGVVLVQCSVSARGSRTLSITLSAVNGVDLVQCSVSARGGCTHLIKLDYLQHGKASTWWLSTYLCVWA